MLKIFYVIYISSNTNYTQWSGSFDMLTVGFCGIESFSIECRKIKVDIIRSQ